MSWQVEMRGGERGGSIYLPQIDLWLDAHRPTETSFVSHAHFDHLATHKRIITSAGTARLMATRLPGEREEIVLPFGEPYVFVNDTELTLHPAGHIFGSAMLLARRAGESLLFTGDFKLRPGRSAERCEPPRADVVIMETTFGLPRYVFPPTADVLAAIIKFCRQTLEDGEVPVLFGYSLGKSQEILSSLADAALPIMLHPQTAKMTHIYEELGQAFPAYRPFAVSEVAGHVVVCPPQANQSAWLRKIKPRRTAAITGWASDPAAIYRYQCDAAFPLSDHADFADLLRFVELVQPKRVLTVHGYTEEFARILRERGIEAWALGKDNQLEIAMAELNRGPVKVAGIGSMPGSKGTDSAKPSPTADGSPVPFERSSSAAAVEPTAATDPNESRAFADVAEKIGATTRKLEKVALLKDYFAALAVEALAPAAIGFTGKPFPSADGRTLNCGWAIIKAALLAVSGTSEADYRATYQRYSDTGDTAQAILLGHTAHEPWPVADWPRFFAELAATRGPLDKKTLLQARLVRLDPLAAKYLIKIITGDLRTGLKEGLVEEAVAAAFARPSEAIREANMLSGDLGATALAARAGTLDKLELRTFNPIHFMLASPEPTAEAIVERLGDPIWVEEKYDGIRCQVHKEGARVEFYSRELRRITGQFPDLAARVREIPADFIADGELLAWQNGRALPFAELQKRLGRRGDDFFLGAEVPVSLWLYDLIAVAGKSLLKLPLRERRAQLDALPLVERIERAPLQQVSGAAAVEAAFLQARKRGNEGLMAKDPASIYLPGRRGLAWLKLKKAYATLDVVVIGVEWGHGKRRNVLSDYTFAIRDESNGALLPVGKAYSGLTDAEIAQYTEFFIQHTLEDFGRYRLVQPVVVLEVAFDTIQKSERHASGYALRFPRILRIRDDKPVSEIDTLAYCRELAEQALHGWKTEAPAS
jgi:DNA ligase-1